MSSHRGFGYAQLGYHLQVQKLWNLDAWITIINLVYTKRFIANKSFLLHKTHHSNGNNKEVNKHILSTFVFKDSRFGHVKRQHVSGLINCQFCRISPPYFSEEMKRDDINKLISYLNIRNSIIHCLLNKLTSRIMLSSKLTKFSYQRKIKLWQGSITFLVSAYIIFFSSPLRFIDASDTFKVITQILDTFLHHFLSKKT